MKTVIMDIMKRSFTELSKESQIILGIIITIITIWGISAFLNMIERKMVLVVTGSRYTYFFNNINARTC